MDGIKLWLQIFLIALVADLFCIPMHFIWPGNVVLVIIIQTFLPIGAVIYAFDEGGLSFIKLMLNLLPALLITGMGYLTLEICSKI